MTTRRNFFKSVAAGATVLVAPPVISGSAKQEPPAKSAFSLDNAKPLGPGLVIPRPAELDPYSTLQVLFDDGTLSEAKPAYVRPMSVTGMNEYTATFDIVRDCRSVEFYWRNSYFDLSWTGPAVSANLRPRDTLTIVFPMHIGKASDA